MKDYTLIIGASTNPERYSYKALQLLTKFKYKVIAVGAREGTVFDCKINTDIPDDYPVDTVTLYINAKLQENYYDKIISLKPRRVIFNPGTENSFFQNMLSQNNIGYLEACTIVMLMTGQY
ncbi:MAG: CoA-binding protein [Bacteroidetes bacterium]|nr:CoA-binding protein [Bacteroidota bacterium]